MRVPFGLIAVMLVSISGQGAFAGSDSCQKLLDISPQFKLIKKTKSEKTYLLCQDFLSSILVCAQKAPFTASLFMLTEEQRKEHCKK